MLRGILNSSLIVIAILFSTSAFSQQSGSDPGQRSRRGGADVGHAIDRGHARDGGADVGHEIDPMANVLNVGGADVGHFRLTDEREQNQTFLDGASLDKVVKVRRSDVYLGKEDKLEVTLTILDGEASFALGNDEGSSVFGIPGTYFLPGAQTMTVEPSMVLNTLKWGFGIIMRSGVDSRAGHAVLSIRKVGNPLIPQTVLEVDYSGTGKAKVEVFKIFTTKFDYSSEVISDLSLAYSQVIKDTAEKSKTYKKQYDQAALSEVCDSIKASLDSREFDNLVCSSSLAMINGMCRTHIPSETCK